MLEALARTTVDVRWIVGTGSAQVMIDPATALLMVRSSSFEGKARPGRVYWMRCIAPQSTFDAMYWFERATIRFAKPVDKHDVIIWEKFFKTHPKPSTLITGPAQVHVQA